MIKHLTFVSVLSIPLVQAASVVVEDFTYDDGPVAGLNGGLGWAGPWGATSDSPSEFEVVSNQAIYMGNGGGQTPRTQDRVFSSSYVLDADTTITLSFDLIVNETQSGRGIGLLLTDSSAGESIFFGKQINGEYGAHSSIGSGGTLYADTGASGTMALVATLTSDGTDTFVSVSANGAAAGTGTISGTQFSFDSMSLNGYHQSTTTNGVDSIDLDVTTIPEPSSTALLGLGGLAFILRRRK